MVSSKTFNDRYIIISLLGEGGVGKVFKVRDTLLDKEFALKVLHKESNELAIARFQKEAKAAGRLKHSNICNIIDFGVDNEGHHYMVMEFLKGKSLAEIILDGPLQSEYTTQILRQICLGLAFAHKNGVIHRDLKPANVQILSDNDEPLQIKLVDFGMAGLIDTDGKLTQTGALVGSPLYMSPELIEGEVAGIQSDIYSLGCLWFELITGHPPFRGNSIIETLSMHKSRKVPELDPSIEITPELKNLLYRCLSKQKKERPQNVEEILALLSPRIIPPEPEETSFVNDSSPQTKNNPLRLLIVPILILVCMPVFLLIQNIEKNKHSTKTAEPTTQKGFLDVPLNEENSVLKFNPIIDKNRYVTLQAAPEESVVDNDLKCIKTKDRYRLVLRNSDELTGSGFENLHDPLLDSLDLMFTGFEDQNIKYLKNFPNLKSLEISSPKITDAAMPNLAQLKNLEILDLDSDKITDNGLHYLGQLTNLKKLTLRCDLMTFDWLNTIKLPELNELLLERVTPTGSITPGLPQFPQLSFLKISSKGTINHRIINALESSKIKFLYLEEEKISDLKMQSIANIRSLNALLLSNSRVTTKGIQSLAVLKNLNQLSMKQNQSLSDDIVKAIATLNLGQLDFSGSNITDEQLSYLLSNSKLEHLILKDCQTSQEQVRLFRMAFQSKWKRECKID